MRRIGISLTGMHRRIETNFKVTFFTQPETQKPASCKSGSGLPGNQFSKTEFRVFASAADIS
jgi:hypothetical protein